MKPCFKCGCVKPLSDFYAHLAMADGRLNKCKVCTKADVTEHRAGNIEKLRAYDRRRSSQPHRVAARQQYSKTMAYAESMRASAKRSDAKYPDRRRARIAVSNALRDGRLTPLPCEVCGDKAHAHHPHYGAPLLVTWLCPPHHKAAHHVTTPSTATI